MTQKLVKYKLLNIFYNREKEIEMPRKLELEEIQIIQNEGAYKSWIKKAKKIYKFVHDLKLSRRRKKENIEINSLEKAERIFKELTDDTSSFDSKTKYRLKMINEHWMNLTVFHYLDDAPATNNAIESYYSTSLKTHRKKQSEPKEAFLIKLNFLR